MIDTCGTAIGRLDESDACRESVTHLKVTGDSPVWWDARGEDTDTHGSRSRGLPRSGGTPEEKTQTRTAQGHGGFPGLVGCPRRRHRHRDSTSLLGRLGRRHRQARLKGLSPVWWDARGEDTDAHTSRSRGSPGLVGRPRRRHSSRFLNIYSFRVIRLYRGQFHEALAPY